MWQQRTTKYSTNSFNYAAAENNKVWYKLIQVVAAENNKVQYKLIPVCGSREQQSMVQTHSSI
jgi:formate dehydrogenase maturation protein FdhE